MKNLRKDRGTDPKTDKRIKPRRGPVDFILLANTMILVLFGLLMVYSASWPTGVYDYNDGLFFFKSQIRAAVIGLGLMILTMNLDYRVYKKLGPMMFVFALLTGLLIFTPLGDESYGATRWIKLGPIGFMPSDLIKVASVIFFANVLAANKNLNRKFIKGTLRISIMFMIPIFIIYLSKDLSTPLILLMALFSMFFAAGLNMGHIIPIVVSLGAIIYKFALDPNKYAYRLERIMSVYSSDQSAYSLNIRWQLNHSLYALGIGGLSGAGLGRSTQKYTYLSFAYNDFIYAVIGEEFGFIGTVIVLILFGLLIIRGVRIATLLKDPAGKYMAIGLTSLIGFQALINMSVVIGLIPTTGVTLPFFSQGGTSLMVTMAAMGVLLNISRYIESKDGEK
ncbi:MAG: cell division protein FtsW [Tissierellia bacterium]|nr:cell division protein FtsW [Tissierellia bacterium]